MASSEYRGLTSQYDAGTQIMEATLFLNAATGGYHPPAIHALALGRLLLDCTEVIEEKNTSPLIGPEARF